MDGKSLVLRESGYCCIIQTSLSQAVIVFKCFCCRELFESDHISNNVLEAIVQKVPVLSLDAWSQLSESERDVKFFCESFFSTQTSYLRPLFGTLDLDCRLILIDTSSKNKMKRIQLYSYSSQKRIGSSESNDSVESAHPQPKSKSARIQPQSPSKAKRNATSTTKSNKVSNQKTKNTQNQNENENQNENPNQSFINMDKAKEHLMLSFVPEHILCREAERADIYNYLHNSILQKGNGSPLYISGRFLMV